MEGIILDEIVDALHSEEQLRKLATISN